LYVLLSGKASFWGRVEEILEQVQRGALVRPARSPAAFRRAEAICLKAMAQKPSQALRHARELATTGTLVADEPVSAFPIGCRPESAAGLDGGGPWLPAGWWRWQLPCCSLAPRESCSTTTPRRRGRAGRDRARRQEAVAGHWPGPGHRYRLAQEAFLDLYSASRTRENRAGTLDLRDASAANRPARLERLESGADNQPPTACC